MKATDMSYTELEIIKRALTAYREFLLYEEYDIGLAFTDRTCKARELTALKKEVREILDDLKNFVD